MKPKAQIKSVFRLYGRNPRRVWIYKVRFPEANTVVSGIVWSWEEALQRVTSALLARAQ